MSHINLIKRLSAWYFKKEALPYWCIMALDCLAVFISGLLVFFVRTEGSGMFFHLCWPVLWGICVCVAAYFIVFYLFHVFKGLLRYSSFVDLYRLALSGVIASFIIIVLHQLEVFLDLSNYVKIPRYASTLLIFFSSTMIMWCMRILVKYFHDIYRGTERTKKAFIYGCLSGGIALAKSIRTETPARYNLAGFISGNQKIEDSWLLGVRVYYDEDSVVEVMKKKGVSVLLVSPLQSQRFTKRTSLIDALVDADIKILMMPSAEEWDGSSDLSLTRLKEVDIEDLLPRDKIEVDMVAIGKMLRGKCVLITGAAGSIGSEISRQVAKLNPSDLILVDQAESPMHDVRRYMAAKYPDLHCETIVTSICKQDRMEYVFSTFKPEFVFHAAAYKHVPMMEDNPAEAVQNNVYGTRVLADLAVKYGTKKFVMISTDKAVNPTNVMGCSKRICEIYCQALGAHQQTTQFVTTRFGNVLGSNGSVIPIFREQIRHGGPVLVTHPDIIRYFMLIPEACRLVLEAGTMGNGGEIYVFDMGEPVKIVDLARRMIRLSGAKNIEIKFTGLRDGEKLYEEVLNDAELTKPTLHPKIKVAAVREYPYEQALKNEIELYELSFKGDKMDIVRKMKEIVPEFKSNNSVYEVLDKKDNVNFNLNDNHNENDNV